MIVTALPPESHRVLSDRLPPELAESILVLPIRDVEWWTSVPAGALVILDPALFARDGVALAIASGSLTAIEARVVFYTTFSPESMRAVALASGLAPVELWISGIDDRAQEFGQRVQRLAAHGLVATVLPRLIAQMESVPRSIRAAVTALFMSPERFFEAADLARAAMTSRRNLDRYLLRNGLGTGRRLIIAAKMIHGMARFGDPGSSRSVRGVADSLGYSDPEVFARQFAEVFGVRPAGRATLDKPLILSAIFSYIRSPEVSHAADALTEKAPSREFAPG